MVLGIRRIPEHYLLKLKGKISPCQMSILSVPPTWIGCSLIIYDAERGVFGIASAIGVLFVFPSRGVDILDGRFARILQKTFNPPDPRTFRLSLSHAGTCEWGEILDPLMDKLSAIPIYLYIFYKYYMMLKNGIATKLDVVILIETCLIGIGILADIAGTIIRMDYFKKKGIIKGKGATWAGKIKALAQWFWPILYFIPVFGWVPGYMFGYSIFLTIVLAFVVSLGLISLFSKMFHFKKEWTTLLKTT